MTDFKDIYDRTDLGNAQRFADQNKDKLKVISGTNQWIKWNGYKWESTTEATVYQAAIKSIGTTMILSHYSSLCISSDVKCFTG